MNFNQIQKTQRNLPKNNKKTETKTKQINSRSTPATNLKIGTYVLNPNFTTEKKMNL